MQLQSLCVKTSEYSYNIMKNIQFLMLYTRKKETPLLYKDIICFFTFPLYTQNVSMFRVKERRR